MKTEFWLLMGVLACGMILSVAAGKLDSKASLAGGLLGAFIYMGSGFAGIAMLAAFFFMGTAATSWQNDYKEVLGIAEKHKGKRTAGQVIANAGMAALLGLLGWLCPEKAAVSSLMMAACFSSATADTLSSELGNVYGRKFYNIMHLKRDRKGLNGVVSMEGTFAGLLGSTVIAVIYGLGVVWNKDIFLVIIAGTVGNLADSVLGATIERSGLIGNNVVNFLNTFLAALTVFLLCWLK